MNNNIKRRLLDVAAVGVSAAADALMVALESGAAGLSWRVVAGVAVYAMLRYGRRALHKLMAEKPAE